jgi:peptide-methionine (R)-S-oxide reductase
MLQRPPRRSKEAPVNSTRPRPPEANVEALATSERAAFAASHPRSEALARNGIEGFYGGVPMHWMLDWSMPFPMIVAEAHGSVLRDVDSNEYADFWEPGTYECYACGLPVFSSETKFQAGTGWPSFWEPISESSVEEEEDRSFFSTRTAVLCARCGGHLGHVFEDGPPPTGLRYCLHNPVVRPMLFASAVQGIFFMFGFYSWQRYFLDVLGSEAVWVTGVVASLYALSGIVGNALVGRVTRGGTAPAAPLLAKLALGQALLVVAVGAFGLVLPATMRGVLPFVAVVALYVTSGVLFGIFRPVRQAFLNPHLRSEQRATALSLDVLFADAGGLAGQPGLGWLSQAISIPFAWVLGGIVLTLAYPLYAEAARRDLAEGGGATPAASQSEGSRS